jgi:hypothetical protein
MSINVPHLPMAAVPEKRLLTRAASHRINRDVSIRFKRQLRTVLVFHFSSVCLHSFSGYLSIMRGIRATSNHLIRK